MSFNLKSNPFLVFILFLTHLGFAQDIIIPVGPGPEDFVVDSVTGRTRLLVSCSSRRKGEPSFGEIISLDLKDYDTLVMYRTGEPVGFSFFPHGIDFRVIGHVPLLFVVNHPGKGIPDQVVCYEVERDILKFVYLVSGDEVISPNDVTATDKGFFFSNDKPFGGSVVYCDESKQCHKVVNKLHFPNGVAWHEKDSMLLVSTTLGNRLWKYTYQNGKAVREEKLFNGRGLDNIYLTENHLYVTGHPRFVRFMRHYRNPAITSPWYLVEYNFITGKKQLIQNEQGSLISAVSSGYVYKGHLFLSQIFGDFIVIRRIAP